MRVRRTLVGVLALGLTIPGLAEAQTPRARTERAVSAPGWIGIMYQITPDGAVVVQEVSTDSPAQRVGLEKGDTLLSWNGRRDVAQAMAERPLQPGDSVRVRLRRGGERDRDVALVAAERPRAIAIRRGDDGDLLVIAPNGIEQRIRVFSDSLKVRADSLHARIQLLMRDSLGPRLRELERDAFPDLEIRLRELERSFPVFEGEALMRLGGRSVAGAEFAEVNEGLAAYFGTGEGVLVLSVAPETPAARAGLQPGDVVVRANGEVVGDVADVRRAVSRAQASRSRRVELEIVRRGQRREAEMRWE